MAFEGVAPLHAARTSQRDVPTTLNTNGKLSDDGKRLGLRLVNNKVIPNDNKDSESIQKLVEKNLQNPELLGDEEQFTREK